MSQRWTALLLEFFFVAFCNAFLLSGRFFLYFSRVFFSFLFIKRERLLTQRVVNDVAYYLRCNGAIYCRC